MSYSQEIYDAVRSKISNGDIGSAVQAVARESFDMSYVRAIAQEQVSIVGYEMASPGVLYRPEIFPDGDLWCALYGKDMQSGVAGFGKTPHDAVQDFNANWTGQTVNAQKAQTAEIKTDVPE